MGISKEIKTEVVLLVASASRMEYDGTPPCITSLSVVIYDFTAMLYGLKNPLPIGMTEQTDDQKYIMNTPQLFEAIYHLVKRCTRASNGVDAVKQLVICQDKRSYVPKGKQKRVKKNPYPAGATISWKGLCETPDSPWQLIDVRRLAESGSVATRALQSWVDYFRDNLHAHDPLPCSVIVDYERPVLPQYPIEFPAAGGEPRLCREWKNEIGETDLMINFWTDVFREADNICLVHRDSDQIPLALEYLLERSSPTQRPKKWLWVSRFPTKDKDTGEMKPGEIYDLLEMYKLIGNNTEFFRGLQLPPHISIEPETYARHRVQAFVVLCVLCGCDWYEKKLLSDQFGIAAVWYAICRTWPMWYKQTTQWRWRYAIPVSDNPKGTTPNTEEVLLLVHFVRWEYHFLLQKRFKMDEVKKKRKREGLSGTLPKVNPLLEYLVHTTQPESPPTRDLIVRHLANEKLKKWNHNIVDPIQTQADQIIALGKLKMVLTYWRYGWDTRTTDQRTQREMRALGEQHQRR